MVKEYMSVKELKSEYLEQLKFKVYYMSVEELENEFADILNDEIILELEKATYPYDIKNDTIYELFSGINFVKEDFESGLK